MSKNIWKVALLNVGLFVVLIVLYFITGFLSGYGANNSYEAAAWRLYIAFIVVHLLINCLLLYRFKSLNLFCIFLSFLEILLLYGAVAWYYK